MRRRILRKVPVTLVPVPDVRGAASFLYDLLKERTPEVSISHKTMPTFKEHVRFVAGHTYLAWYLIKAGEDYVGSIYLTFHNEIGVFILKKCQGHGYGSAAIRALMQQHRPRHERGETGWGFLANINPMNKRSAAMFKKLGFKLIQHTYQLT